MRELLARAGLEQRGIRVIADAGADFAEHYDHAFRQCFDAGADCILSTRGDLPALKAADVQWGFEQLHALCDQPCGGGVLAPNQSAGVSLAGWTRKTCLSHAEVFECRNAYGVLSAYVRRAAAHGLPVSLLPSVPDVDTMDDLRHSMSLVQALNYSAGCGLGYACPPWRTATALYRMDVRDVMVKPVEP